MTALTEGPVGGHLWRLSGPMAIGILAVLGFNLVDTWFVGLLGTEPLAAISFTFPVVAVLGNLAMGIGVGTTSLISRTIGEAHPERVRRYATDALTLAVATVVVGATIGYFTIDPLFRLLGAPDAMLPLIGSYMRVWYLGMVFLVVPMVGMSVIRATGDTRTPAVVMVIAGVLNGVLDPVLIFGLGPIPALGLTGAALATVISRAFTLAIAIYVLAVQQRLLCNPLVSLRALLASWRPLITVALPAAGANLTVPVTVAILTALIAIHGEEAVAAFGAASRVEIVALIPLLALASGMAPLVGQNWGAKRLGRVQAVRRLAFGVAVGYGLVSWGLLAAGSGLIGQGFTEDPVVAGWIALYLMTVPVGHGAQGIHLAGASIFNASGLPVRAMVLSLLRTPTATVGFALLGDAAFGLGGLFGGAAAANLLAGLIAFAWTQRLCRTGPRSSITAKVPSLLTS